LVSPLGQYMLKLWLMGHLWYETTMGVFCMPPMYGVL